LLCVGVQSEVASLFFPYSECATFEVEGVRKHCLEEQYLLILVAGVSRCPARGARV
jgi:hypothetical protein